MLPEREVHSWHARLDLEVGRLEALAGGLDPAELARASRFSSERERERFVAGRGILRNILGQYLGVPPGSLRFGYSPRGKPFLLPRSSVQFNVSHTGARLIVVVARNRRLGVDVETYPSIETVDAVAGRVLSDEELEQLRRVDRSQQPAVFARLWTRKEAYLKADGRGVTGGLHRVDAGTLTDKARVLDDVSGEWTEDPRWTLRELDLDPPIAGCVAAEGADWELVTSEWETDLHALAAG